MIIVIDFPSIPGPPMNGMAQNDAGNHFSLAVFPRRLHYMIVSIV
jgi:hypothetical protein